LRVIQDTWQHLEHRDHRFGQDISQLRRLRKVYGGQRWRKLKGTATVKLADGTICYAELHWYAAHGVGPREFKIKRIVEIQ
jgi:hypothetical protein